MSRDSADMFSFAEGPVNIEMVASSGPVAQAAGEAFVGNLNQVSSASMDAANNVPMVANQGLSLA